MLGVSWGFLCEFDLRGVRVIFLWSLANVYVFNRPSCITLRSNNHGRPNRTWQASIGTMSHQISSL